MSQETENNQETNNQETNNQETNNQEVKKHRIALPEGIVELNDDELLQAARIGVETKIKENREKAKEEGITKKDVQQKEGESDKKYLERLEKLERKLEEKEANEKDQAIVSFVSNEIKKVKELEGWEDDIQSSILTDIAVARKNSRETRTLQQVIDERINKWKKRLEKFSPKVNIEEIEKTKKDLGSTSASGKGGGEEVPKKLGRNDFRSGKLTNSVYESMKRMVDKASK